MSILEKLATVAAETLGVERDALLNASSFEELELDSLALLELNVAIQKCFNVALGDDEISPEHSLAYVSDLIEKRQESADA